MSSVAHIIDSADAKHQEIIRGDHVDILLQKFWVNGTNADVDVGMTYVDAALYDNMTTKKFLAKHEQAKKKKYLQACLAQRIHFTLLVFSIDWVLGQETKAFAKRLANHLALKWNRPFSRVEHRLCVCYTPHHAKLLHPSARYELHAANL